MKNSQSYHTEEQRWQAICQRESRADRYFVYACRLATIYYFPSDPTRLPLRENLLYFSGPQQAEAAGYQANLRRSKGQAQQSVIDACRLLASVEQLPTLPQLSAYFGLSSSHFHRLFTTHIGVTPRAYYASLRAQKVRDQLGQSPIAVTETVYNVGFHSSSRFYAVAPQLLGMKPNVYRQGGKGMQIYFAVGVCSLGNLLIGQTSAGICAIFMGDDAEQLVEQLQDTFPKAELVGANRQFEQTVAQVVAFIQQPQREFPLPLDIQGTLFQQKVWHVLRQIPPGTTISYSQLAESIGQPTATRAVASACAANTIAVAIPCHRVVRQNGELSGYRWGIARKQRLLLTEHNPED